MNVHIMQSRQHHVSSQVIQFGSGVDVSQRRFITPDVDNFTGLHRYRLGHGSFCINRVDITIGEHQVRRLRRSASFRRLFPGTGNQ